MPGVHSLELVCVLRVNVLPVWPTYTLRQSLQEIVYVYRLVPPAEKGVGPSN